MADSKRKFEILFGGEDAGLKKAIDAYGDKLESLGDTAGDLAAPFADVAKAVIAVDAALVGVGVALLKISSDGKNATEKLRASLGLLPEEAERFGKIAKDVYGEGLGETIEGSSQAVAKAFQLLGDSSEEALNESASAALKLQGIFGADLNESLSAVKTLMDNFGLTSEEAFGKITVGFQKGLDRSGDFLETIQEYSTQFKNGGASANEFFNLLESGAAGGALGVDKAADAFKEFRVRIQDGSKTTKEALELIGLSSDEMAKDLASGSIVAADAFVTVIEKLKQTGDSSKQIQAGVGLLGTQFEDLGTKAALNLNLTGDSFDDTAKAVASLNKEMQSVIGAFEVTWRKVTNAITETDVFKEFEAGLTETLQAVGTNFEEAFSKVDLSGLERSIKGLVDGLSGSFKALFGDIDITTVEGLEKAIQKVVDTIESVVSVTDGIVKAWTPFLKIVGDTVDWFNDLDDSSKQLSGNVLGLAGQVSLLAGGLGTAGLALKGISSVIGGLSPAISGLSGAASSAAAALSGPVGLAAAAGVVGVAIGTLINQIPGVQKLVQGLIGVADELIRGKNLNVTGDTEKDIQNKATALENFRRNIKAVKDEASEPVKVEFNIAEELELAKIRELGRKLQEEIQKQKLELLIEANKKQIKEQIDSDLAEVNAGINDIIFSVDVELDSNAQKNIGTIEKIDDELRELSNRRNEIIVYSKFLTAKGEVPPNELAQEYEKIGETIEDLTKQKNEITVELQDNESFQKVSKVSNELETLTEKRRIIDLQTEVNEGTGLGEIVDELTVLEDGSYFIEMKASLQGGKEVKEEIKDLTKTEEFLLKIDTKRLEEETKRITAEIEAQSDIITAALEWEAKVELANVEADLEKFNTTIEGSTSVVTELADSMIGLFGAFGEDLSRSQIWLLEDTIRQQLEIQREQAGIAKKRLEIETERARIRNELLTDPNKRLISFDITGAEPAIEAVMWAVLKTARIEIDEFGLDQLLDAP
jgi:hypothetical protein